MALRLVLVFLTALILSACATQAQMQARSIATNTDGAVSQFQACADAIASSPDYDPLRARTPLDVNKATLEQLTQTNKITPAEKAAVFKNYANLQGCRQALLENLQHSTPTVIPILAAAYTKNDMLLVQLVEGRITWGQELQAARKLSAETSVELNAEMQRIAAGLQLSHEAELHRRQRAAAALAAYAQQQQVIDALNRPVQVNVHQQPTTTNCRRVGNAVNCTTW